MSIQVKKEKYITLRISKEDKDKIDEIRKIDSNFNLSYFIRDKIAEKYSQVLLNIGTFKIG